LFINFESIPAKVKARPENLKQCSISPRSKPPL
jgi:hypothetical protein